MTILPMCPTTILPGPKEESYLLRKLREQEASGPGQREVPPGMAPFLRAGPGVTS